RGALEEGEDAFAPYRRQELAGRHPFIVVRAFPTTSKETSAALPDPASSIFPRDLVKKPPRPAAALHLGAVGLTPAPASR
ncbi:MAG: hypothetical protein ACK53L_35560, partial [Pirellulaceae bacterium]